MLQNLNIRLIQQQKLSKAAILVTAFRKCVWPQDVLNAV